MSGKNPDARYVFVSHSGADTWVAKQIAREISACGAVPFLDEAEIDIGSDFEEDILAFLEKAHELVVLLTPWSLERPYVWAEIGAAWARRIPIIALLHGMTEAEFQSRPGVPVLLKKRDLLTLNQIDQYFHQLKQRVESLHAAAGRKAPGGMKRKR
jgi:TIR domain